MAYGQGMVKDGAMNQHKSMAGAGSSGSFGVGKLPQRDHQHPDASMSHAPLEDAKRGASGPLMSKGRSMQAAPDHGPAGHDHFNRDGKY